MATLLSEAGLEDDAHSLMRIALSFQEVEDKLAGNAEEVKVGQMKKNSWRSRTTLWRNRSFWSKVGPLLGGDSSSCKRLFSPEFVSLCVFVVMAQLIALNHWYVLISERDKRQAHTLDLA